MAPPRKGNVAEPGLLGLSLREKLQNAKLGTLSVLVARTRLGFLRQVPTITPHELAKLEHVLEERKIRFCAPRPPEKSGQKEAISPADLRKMHIETAMLAAFWEEGIYTWSDLAKRSLPEIARIMRVSKTESVQSITKYIKVRIERIDGTLKARGLRPRVRFNAIEKLLINKALRFRLAAEGIETLAHLEKFYGRKVRRVLPRKLDPSIVEIAYILYIYVYQQKKRRARRKRPRQ